MTRSANCSTGNVTNSYAWRVLLPALVILLLSAFLLRTSQLAAFPPGVRNDEAKNLIDAAHIAQAGSVPLYEDGTRPDPFYQFNGWLSSLLFGNTVWAFRFASALWGFLTLPAVYWASRQCFADEPVQLRNLAALLAVVVVSTSLGHITVSRSLYRAVPLTCFVVMALGFLCKALLGYSMKDFIAGGCFIALGIYTYTSALIVPLIYALIFVSLLCFQRAKLRRWLPGLLASGAILLLLTAPVAYLLLTQPSALLARAGDVAAAQDADMIQSIGKMLRQFVVQGDGNPQYNVADAPLIDPLVTPLFVLGIGYFVFRYRRPQSAVILGLLLLSAIPALLSNEIPHGLRIYGVFAIIPIVAGAGLFPVVHLLGRLGISVKAAIVLLLIAEICLFAALSSLAWSSYFGYWDEARGEGRSWRIYDRDLLLEEWFFRTDRVFLIDWIQAQEHAVLVPIEELNAPAQRALLMSRFPITWAEAGPVELAADTLVVIPWSLERGAFLDDSTHFALLEGGIIRLLPPLTHDAQASLRLKRPEAQALRSPAGSIPVLAKYFALESDHQLAFNQPAKAEEPVARFNEELELLGWHGPDSISGPGAYSYTLDFAVNRSVSHRYGAFLQLHTPQWQSLAGEDRLLYRWLYPTLLWTPNAVTTVEFALDLTSDLAPGAYRLAAGAWHVNGGLMKAESFVGEEIPTAASIGWVKVPQRSAPAIPPSALKADVTFGDAFRLTHFHVSAATADFIEITLYWTARVDRPAIDATVFVHAQDETGALAAQSDMRPWNGQYPTFIWDAGELVATEHRLVLSNKNDISLFAGMYSQPGATRLKATQEYERLPGDRAALGKLAELLPED